MSRVEKLKERFYKKPIPNDITFDELEVLANHYGCEFKTDGGRHSCRVYHAETGTIIPIPRHGKEVKEAYIKQVKNLFDRIDALKEEK